jgi:predicted membrane metal-binding protein
VMYVYRFCLFQRFFYRIPELFRKCFFFVVHIIATNRKKIFDFYQMFINNINCFLLFFLLHSLNNFKLCDDVDSIYRIQLEIKNTIDTARSASCLDLHLEKDSEACSITKLYDKRDVLTFVAWSRHLNVKWQDCDRFMDLNLL